MTGRRYAVLIASSRFPDEPALQSLSLPERDVDGMQAVLSAPDLGGFIDPIVIKNRPHHEALRKINHVLRQAEQDDFVLIYYSGHGKLDGAGRLYLATTDTELAVLESTSIPVERIRTLFDNGGSSRTALILDCCYSGAVDRAFRSGIDDQLNLMSGGRGTFIMTASTGIQTAQEKEGDEFGLFTKHVINGIRSGGADRDGDGLITMSELYSYVHENVLRESAQEPMRWNLNVRGELVVAKSGKASREERRRVIRGLLLELSRQNLLPDRVLSSALELLAVPLSELKGKLKRRDDLLTSLAAGEMGSADFVAHWVDVEQAPRLQPDSEASAARDARPQERQEAQRQPQEDAGFGRAEATSPHSRLDDLPPASRNAVIPLLWFLVASLIVYLATSLTGSIVGFTPGFLIVVVGAIVLFAKTSRHLSATGKALLIAATLAGIAVGVSPYFSEM